MAFVMLKSLIKTASYWIAPKTASAILSARARAYSHRLVKDWGLFDINQKLIREIGNVVTSGPFGGLTLTPMACQGHVGPYLLGTYEMELHPWWEQVFRAKFRQIVNIGTNFGYYAVGVAHRFPDAAIVAFDTDWWAREAIAEMVSANGVANVSVQRFCSTAWLEKNLQENALIVSDCEGYEGELLCTAEIPALNTATMIIELHESFSPGVSSKILARFAPTHTIGQVSSRPDTPMPGVRVRSLTQDEIRRASAEVRPPQTWVFLLPKVADPATSHRVTPALAAS